MMNDPITDIVDVLRSLVPGINRQAVIKILLGIKVFLGDQAISIINSNFVIASTVEGDLIQYVQVEPLKFARATFATMPLDSVPPPASSIAKGSLIPYPHNQQFVGHEEYLKKLAAVIAQKEHAIIVPSATITGIGGIGKTNLALEFAYRYGQYFRGGVFWIACDTFQTMLASIAESGGPAGLNLYDPQILSNVETQVKLVVKEWQDEIPRLLIFDNCEYRDVQSIRGYIPNFGGFHIIMTSRYAEWPHTTSVELDVLTRAESIQFLHQLVPVITDDQANRIAEQLGDLPLALQLAGSYMSYFAEQPAVYLKQLFQSDVLSHPSLQGEGTGYSPTDHDRHVARTFALSYSRIQQLGSEYERRGLLLLLDHIVCFAPGLPIPYDLLFTSLEQASDFAKNAENRDRSPDGSRHERVKFLKSLINLGLITNEANPQIHRLVQQFVLKKRQPRKKSQQAVGETVALAIRDTNINHNVAEFIALRGHAQYMVDAAWIYKTKYTANLCSVYGYALFNIAQYLEAQRYLEHCESIRRKTYTRWHPKTASAYYLLALNYQMRCEFTKAQKFYEKALPIRTIFLGRNNPQTLSVLTDFAYMLFLMGNYVHSERLIHKALDRLRTSDGDQRNTIARNLNNIGYMYLEQGRYRRSWWYLRFSLALRENILHPTHIGLAQTLCNIGGVCLEQGYLSQAQHYLERAWSIRQAVYGNLPHVDTAESDWSMGRLYYTFGDLEQARSYLE